MPINRYEDEGVANYWNSKYEQSYHPYLHGRQKKVLDLISQLNCQNHNYRKHKLLPELKNPLHSMLGYLQLQKLRYHKK